MKKRVVSLLLCLIMALSLIPTAAFAAEASSQDDGISLTSIVQPDDQSYYTYEFYLSRDSIEPYSTQIVKQGEKLYQPETPQTEEGKVFTGWYDKKGNLFTGFGKVDEITKSDTIKLTARIEDGYYVFFKKTDGTVIDTITGKTNDKVTFDSVSFPVNANQAITGWYTDKDCTSGKQVESVTIKDSNITLYAKVEEGHWITFDSDGGSYVEPKFFATSKNTLKPNDPAKPGYAFVGWNTEDGTAYTFGNLLAANITLKAKWTAQNGVKYTVIHWQENANDDEYSFAESEQLTGTPGQLTEDAVDKSYEGFTLNKDKTDAQKTIAGDGSTIVNVYYKRNVYKVTFASNSDQGDDLLCGKEEHSHSYTDRRWKRGSYKYTGGCYPANSYSRYPICGKDEHAHTHGNLFQSSCYGTIYKELTIEAKYGAYIGDKWPTYPSLNGSSTWAVERNGKTYQVNINTMPLGGATFYGPKTGHGSETAYYYVEVLPGETGTPFHGVTYKEHHRDTSPGTGYTVSNEDKYSITGFTYKEGTGNGDRYDNAKFYYTRNIYNIVFISGGQKVNTLSKKFEQSITDVNYTPTAPEGKEGYQFAGWYDNELGEGKAYDFNGKTMPANNITLYAKWVAPTYTVTVYNQNDKYLGEIHVSKGDTVTNELSKLEAQLTLAPGDSFLGWTINRNRSLPFNPGTKITTNYDLYAKVGNNATYTVTYKANNGSDDTVVDPLKYAMGAYASVKANSFNAPSGQVFLGWSTTASGSVAYYANSKLEITGNMELYAIWGDKDSTVTLTYNANYEGANPATNTISSIKNNAKVTLKQFTDLFPARDGYQFTGWNTQADGSGTPFIAGSDARVNNDDGDNVLYAQWVRQTGTLTITKKVEGLTGTSAPTEFNFTVTGPNNYSKDVTVSANGSLPLTGLPVGEYTVKEKPTDIPGYTLNTTYKTDAATAEPTTEKATVTVTANTDATVTVTNTYAKDTTSVTVTKEWNDNLVKALRPESVTVQLMKNDVPVDGALVVLDDNNQWSHTWTDLPMYNDTGSKITYSVKEVNVPAGYTVAVNPVATAATPTFTITNTANVVEAPEIVPASLTVIKKDADNGALLKGAKFTLIPEGGKATDAAFAETDENGKAVFTDLAKGTYTLKEITAPAGYQATDKTWTITVSDDAQTAGYVLKDGKFVKTVTCKVDDVNDVVANGSITITNVKATGTVTINKVLKGLNATDFDKPFTFTIWQGAKAVKSVKVWPGNPVTLTLDPGKYTIVEKSADKDGYDLTTEYDKETFTVEAGKNVTVTVTNTYTKKVTPPPAEYTLSVDIQKNIELKRSSSRKPGKASFTFEAYLVDEKGNETILDTVTIDTKGTKSADGTLTFTLTEDDLSVTGHGTVYVREVKGSTRGWTYDDTVYALGVELTTDGKLNIISVDTKRIDKPATLEFTNVYYKRSTTTGGGDKPIQSVKTGDMGIAMYAMTSLLSLGGAALVIKKRKEEK